MLGLAPAAHGGNRTGRVFTGDRSGDQLFAALYRAGLVNSPISVDAADGLSAKVIRISAAVRCAPPGNAPTPEERATCAPWLDAEWRLIAPHVRVIVALGGFAWRAALRLLGNEEWAEPPSPAKPKFGHGVVAELASGRQLLGCYHPSQQNMFTGRLTPAMLDDVFADARRRAGNSRRRVVLNSSCDFPYSTWSRSAATRPGGRVGGHRAARADRRPARLHPLLAGRTPQHAGRRGHQPAGADRHLAAQTTQLRLGSGGVMLPNHAPLAVAEQFARCWRPPRRAASTWASAGPGLRPGDLDHVARHRDGADVENFPQYLDDVAALMGRARVRIPIRGRDHPQGHPGATGEPRIWLLGSSLYSAHLAAARGLPLCVRHFRAGHGRGAGVYRSGSGPRPGRRAGDVHDRQRGGAPTRSEAEALLLPNLQLMARLRTGQPLGPLDLVEDAATTTMAPQAGRSSRPPVTGPSSVRRPRPPTRSRSLADEFDVDEVMVNPVASAHRGTDPGPPQTASSPLELLAKELF